MTESRPSTPHLDSETLNALKLEAVGRLAAGIAHEINTPAQYIGDSLHFVQEAFQAYAELGDWFCRWMEDRVKDSEQQPQVEQMRQLAERLDLDYLKENVPESLALCTDGLASISRLTQALTAFSQADIGALRPVDLNQAILDTLVICRSEYRYVADVDTQLAPLPLVQCCPEDIHQVLLGLIVNAAHSVAERVEKTQERGRIGITTSLDRDWVRVEIEDTGSGIPESIREHMYEPFFTTKPLGKGVGTSLAIAKTVVEGKHGGRLYFDSEPGRGATFVFELPVLPGRDEGQGPVGIGGTSSRREVRRGRVLVLDDEPATGVAMGRLLRRECETVLCTGAQQALALLENDQRFDIILCDLFMPGLTGMDFFDRLRERSPQLADRVVFITAAGENPATREFLSRAGRPSLLKPVAPQELITLVRGAMLAKGTP